MATPALSEHYTATSFSSLVILENPHGRLAGILKCRVGGSDCAPCFSIPDSRLSLLDLESKREGNAANDARVQNATMVSRTPMPQIQSRNRS